MAETPRLTLVPPRKTFTDLPIAGQVSIFDTVPAVNQALDELENGMFASSSLVVEAMGRDDRIRGVLDTRINSLLGLPLTFEASEAAGKSKSAAKVADAVKPLFSRMFPRHELTELLRWGHFHSYAPVELRWQDWTPAIRTWHPLPLYWDWSDRVYKIATVSDAVVPLVPGDPKWMQYAPHGLQRGWMWGLARALAMAWMVRKFTYRDWARYCEVHGLPIRKAVVPARANDPHKDRFRRSIAAIGSETTVETMVNDQGEPIFDIQLLEAAANTYEGFQELIRQAEESIAICLLGQNLTTQVKGGSFAAAQVHDRVRADFLRFDAESLAETLRDQVLIPWVRFNFDAKNAEELAPRIRWQTDPPEDKGDKSKAFLALGQAFAAFNAAGVAVDKKQVLEDFGIPYTGNGEMDPVIPGKTDAGDAEDDEPDGDEGDDSEKEALARDGKPGWQRGQDFADRIVATSVDRATELLRPDLAKVLGAIRAATSPEDLKGRLLKLFEGMDAGPLKRELERAGIMGRLGGRWSVLEDL